MAANISHALTMTPIVRGLATTARAIVSEFDCPRANNCWKKVDNARHLTATPVERIAIVSSDAIIAGAIDLIASDEKTRSILYKSAGKAILDAF
jgi:hypothetical protein